MKKSNNFATFKGHQRFCKRNDLGELLWYAHILDRSLPLSITPIWQLFIKVKSDVLLNLDIATKTKLVLYHLLLRK